MAAKNESKPEEVRTSEPEGEKVAAVQSLPNGWALVTYGSWQVSVSPDGLLMLPRHLRPEDVPDFMGASVAAADVGVKIRAAAQESAKTVDTSRRSRRLIVQEGAPPDGAVRIPVASGEKRQKFVGPHGSIGRRTQSQAGPQPAGTQGRTGRTRIPGQPRGR